MKHKERAEEILRYIDEHGIVDKDSLVSDRKHKKKVVLKKSQRTVRKVVDLHGKTASEAERVIRKAVDDCRICGMRELLIIHGQGIHSDPSEGPVLKKLVREIFNNEYKNRVRGFSAASPKHGGGGATLIYLR